MATRAIEPPGVQPRPWTRRTIRRAERPFADRAPLPEPAGLAETLSPVDLPEPAAQLPHPLRWTSTTIAVATLFLALFNAHALRSWSYQLTPNEYSARVVAVAESWYAITDRAGLNRPVEAMHGWWQGAKEARFGAPVAPPDMAAAEPGPGPAPPSRRVQR